MLRVKILSWNFLQHFSGFNYLKLSTWNSITNDGILILLNKSSESSFLKDLLDPWTSRMSVSLRRSGTQHRKLVSAIASGMRGNWPEIWERDKTKEQPRIHSKSLTQNKQNQKGGGKYVDFLSLPPMPTGRGDMLQEREKIKQPSVCKNTILCSKVRK